MPSSASRKHIIGISFYLEMREDEESAYPYNVEQCYTIFIKHILSQDLEKTCSGLGAIGRRGVSRSDFSQLCIRVFGTRLPAKLV